MDKQHALLSKEEAERVRGRDLGGGRCCGRSQVAVAVEVTQLAIWTKRAARMLGVLRGNFYSGQRRCCLADRTTSSSRLAPRSLSSQNCSSQPSPSTPVPVPPWPRRPSEALFTRIISFTGVSSWEGLCVFRFF